MTWHCQVVVVVGVVERLREVVHIGGGGDEAEVVDDGGREGKSLFVYDVYENFRQTPLTRLSIKRRWSLSHNITNLSHHAPFIYKISLSFKQTSCAFAVHQSLTSTLFSVPYFR